MKAMRTNSVIHSFIPLACAECNDSLPFSGASSIPLSPHPAIYFLVHLSILLFPNSYTILFGNSIFFHSLYMPKPYNLEVRHPRCVGSITKEYCVLYIQLNTTIFTLGSVGSWTQLSLRCNILVIMYWETTTCFGPWWPSSGCLGST